MFNYLMGIIGSQALLSNAILNPNTGDRNAGVMGIVIAALVVSAILIVAYLVWSSSQKKKGGKGKKRK